MPTRALPGSIDIPYAFWPAPEPHVASVLSRYHDAATASRQATARIAVVAEAARAPSQVLTPARDAARSGSGPAPRRDLQASTSHDAPDQLRGLPGPFENVLHQLGVTDPHLLQRATALDRDGTRLIIRAAEGLSPSSERSAFSALSGSMDAAPIINIALASSENSALSTLASSAVSSDMQREASP